MKLRKTTKEEFEGAITDEKGDKFAKTFLSKANMGGEKYWDRCIGAWTDEGELMGAIIVTISIRRPHVANLQLLHTFWKHRKKGVAKELCEDALLDLWNGDKAQYFRVSSEIPAIPFYEKIGWVMLGKQKSGCQLSMFKIIEPYFHKGKYDINDPVINKAVFRKGKGGVVELLVDPPEITQQKLF